jgi:2-phosphosulfolactate phosphatase
MALARGAKHIITGSFPNIGSVCNYLASQEKPVILGCAAWKNRVNIEDTLFAGAVINRIKEKFNIQCDSSAIAESLYIDAGDDLFEFLKLKQASHFRRLTGFGLDADLRYCLTMNIANVLPFYENQRLIVHRER